MDVVEEKEVLEKSLERLLREDCETFANAIGERPMMFRQARYLVEKIEVRVEITELAATMKEPRKPL